MNPAGANCWSTLAVALTLASVHLFAGKLRFLDATPRSIWLSVAGGASVSYVFLHVLPELAEYQRGFNSAEGWFATLERHVWLLSLAGLAAFYGLERAVRESQARRDPDNPRGSEATGVFWLHIASFAIYNALFGYLLAHRDAPARELVPFGLAIGLHFVVNDFGLHADHRESYDRRGRWTLAVGILAGWTAGTFLRISELGVGALFAVVAGGIILNVLKEELPDERRSRFWAFAAGAAAYAVLLTLVA